MYSPPLTCAKWPCDAGAPKRINGSDARRAVGAGRTDQSTPRLRCDLWPLGTKDQVPEGGLACAGWWLHVKSFLTGHYVVPNEASGSLAAEGRVNERTKSKRLRVKLRERRGTSDERSFRASQEPTANRKKPLHNRTIFSDENAFIALRVSTMRRAWLSSAR